MTRLPPSRLGAEAGTLALLVLLLVGGCRALGPGGPFEKENAYVAAYRSVAQMQTRAERTDYRETSRYGDIVEFLLPLRMLDEYRAQPSGFAGGEPFGPDPLPSDGWNLSVYDFGTSVEGRALPVVIARGAGDRDSLRQSEKTRVLVFANIHAGEVAGKEAALMLIRDLAQGQHTEWADSLVVMIAPIYNADGNERFAYSNRPRQWGPVGGMGQRPNAQGLDLNRDFMKLASPEARGLVGFLNDADPHVIVDLHTTNGTHMGYHLTYAPPLSPNTPEAIDRHLRDEWLPAISDEILRTDDMATEHYGNTPGTFGPANGVPRGWYSFSAQPRFGTNYGGLRNRYAILSEAYSYASFEDRVTVTKRFVEEILHAVHRDASRVRAITEAADATSLVGDSLAVRAFFTAPNSTREILIGAVDTLAHPETGDPMFARRDVRTPEAMPVFSRFGATETERVPEAYLVPSRLGDVLDLLTAHGIRTEPQAEAVVDAQVFRVDSVRVAERPFQNVRQREAFGAWSRSAESFVGPLEEEGYVRVPMDQPLARVAFALLEPRSDDGVVNWGIVDLDTQPRAVYPILREPARLGTPTETPRRTD
ncbi:MAG: M14 family metallopeptidase [Bacteroidota bacterium]